jgi:dienelactone hydrolase
LLRERVCLQQAAVQLSLTIVIVHRKLGLAVVVGTWLVCAFAGCGESDAAGTEDDAGIFVPGPDGALAPSQDAAQTLEAGTGSGTDAGYLLDADLDDAQPAGNDATPSGGDDSGVNQPLDGGSDSAALPPSDAATDAAQGADTGTASSPAPTLPTKGGTCPTFTSGDANFAPAGIAVRKVRLWVGTNGGGPLVIYWHSTGAQPSEAQTTGLKGVLDQITAAGGVVAAPYTGANDGTFPWLSTTSESLKVADEVVACAIEEKSIDARRIHVIGFSAGGLMTSTMSFQRSAYVASVAPYSGGQQGSASFQDASNKFAALIFHGGSSDAFVINFQTTSTSYSNTLRSNGNYALLCNHGGGHAIPSAGPAAAWRFFQDHPYRSSPSPYVASGLPASLPSYCQAPP